ncbi:MAG: PadR family transcriptional regulator [Sandaracinaceae bacterium]
MRFRPERGEVRFLVLDALSDGPSHGYEIIARLEEKTEGAYKPSPGTIYPLLSLLEDLELVSVEADGKRKRYELTDAGRAELEAHREDIDEAYERVRGPDFGEHLDFRGWRRRLKRVMRAVGHETRRGRLDKKQLTKIREIIDGALDQIEALLRED